MIDEVPQQLHLPRNPELCVTVGQQQAGTTSLLLESSDPQFVMSAIDRFNELLRGHWRRRVARALAQRRLSRLLKLRT